MENLIVQCQQRVGVVREEPVALEVVAGVLGGLLDVDPVSLECRGKPVDGRETETERSRDGGANERRPGFADQRPEKRDAGHEIAGHHAQGKVREPRAGERERERCG